MLGLDTLLKSGSRHAKAHPAPHLTPPGGLPTHEQIAVRAYEIYATNGYAPDRTDDNWMQAERELLEETLDAEV